jgi:hypothetical protein
MLRAIVGLCIAVALCGLVSQCLWASGHAHAGYGPASPTSQLVSTPSAVVIDLELETELSNQSAELPAFDLPGEPAVTHRLMGRMDRQTTHLELLLTCGRLLI